MDSISIILIIIGIVLLVAEIFIPSFGVTGVIGVLSILGGVILTANTIMEGVILFSIILVVAIILMFIAYRFFASKGSPLILAESLKEDHGNDELQFFVGKKGVAITPLRPAGNADFDGVRLDVLTRGEFIEKGTPVTVFEVIGKKIMVQTIVKS